MTQFCHNLDCPARGQPGQGNLILHRQQEQRYRWTRCGKTFAAPTGTPFYRLRQPGELGTIMLTLLTHGCPVQALVAAFGLDERTGAAGLPRAGRHAQDLQQHLIPPGQIDLQQVQADEVWVKLVGRRGWQALAIAVPSRWWLGGGLSAQRDRPLIRSLGQPVRASAVTRAILVCVAGVARSVTAFRQGLRQRIASGKPGRPRLEPEAGGRIGHVITQEATRHVIGIPRRIVPATPAAVAAVLAATRSGTASTTASIERLNATLCSALACLVRRGRAIAHTEPRRTAGMWLVGSCDNFCWDHDSRRERAPRGAPRQWDERTEALAAGLTDHHWTLCERLPYQVPPPPWIPPKRRGRPPKQRPVGAPCPRPRLRAVLPYS